MGQSNLGIRNKNAKALNLLGKFEGHMETGVALVTAPVLRDDTAPTAGAQGGSLVASLIAYPDPPFPTMLPLSPPPIPCPCLAREVLFSVGSGVESHI